MEYFKGPEWVKQYCIKRVVLSECVQRWEFTYQGEHGDIYICMPYPGIHLWVNDIHMQRIPTEKLENYHFIKLNYCSEGRAEVLLADERYVYLEKGILSVDVNAPKNDFVFPGSEYVGLEMIMDMSQLKDRPVPMLLDCGVDLNRIERDLKKTNGSCLAAVSDKWRETAEQGMDMLRKAEGEMEDFRFFTLQLLYLLQKGGTISPEKKSYLTRGQRRIVANAEEKLTENLKCRYTVEQLAGEYKISPSSLKKYFEQVYGIPISEYLRKKRMESACRLLTETRMSVADIAAEVGYSNQGKFGSVFKKYTDKTPLEYRRLQAAAREAKLQGLQSGRRE